MTPLERCLRQIPGVYAELEQALVPGRSGEPSGAPDPIHRPAPANLSVTDHRHKLVRGLRWWVDALHGAGSDARVGHSVPLMCLWLHQNRAALEAEDAETLTRNLQVWLAGAWEFMGDPTPTAAPQIPLEAYGQTVSQAVAARALGVSVSTVWRRAGRGGPVVLGEVARSARCEVCDLIEGQCPHTRVTVELA